MIVLKMNSNYCIRFIIPLENLYISNHMYVLKALSLTHFFSTHGEMFTLNLFSHNHQSRYSYDSDGLVCPQVVRKTGMMMHVCVHTHTHTQNYGLRQIF